MKRSERRGFIKKLFSFLLALVLCVGMLPAPEASAMQIFVSLNVEGYGETLTLEVEPGDSIDNVKAKIRDMTSIQTDRQQLYAGDVLMENGHTLADYSIQKEATLRLVVDYTVGLSTNPAAGGTVSGGGRNASGASVTVTAAANDGYTFVNWTENDTEVSTDASYTFTVTGNRTLTANFAPSVTAPGSGGSLIGGIPATANGGCVYVNGIKWRVIGASDTAWLLISAEVLEREMGLCWSDAMDYGSNYFNNSFSGPEQGAVTRTTKSEGNYDCYNGYMMEYYGGSTLDNATLFLLSAAEAETYFSGDSDRKPGMWWLRSPSAPPVAGIAGAVFSGGDLSHYSVDDAAFGARPAFQLNLEAVLFASVAAGGKSSTVAGSGTFGNLNTSGEAKLTLLDSSRGAVTANVAGASSATVQPGGSFAVTYSGVTSGDNISALLCDASGAILYYASLTPDGSGVWNMTLPDMLTEGRYTLKLFSEQLNGDHETDYASAPTTITLTVPSLVLTGSGTEADPYLIASPDDWNALASFVSLGGDTAGKVFLQTENISVTTMIGTEEKPFKGTYDGGEHTLTFTSTDHPERTAPFRYIRDAAIRHLHVDGSITGSGKRAAGLIGENNGVSTVTDCRVSAEISGSNLVGGFCIGTGDTLTITGCVFDGTITGSPNQSGCFVAWGTSGLTITDSMAAPQSDSVFTGGTFCYEGGGAPTLNNCYFMQSPGNAQGKRAYSVRGGDGVTLNFGTPTADYTVSGVKAYATGLVYGELFYAGQGESVTLTVTPAEGYVLSSLTVTQGETEVTVTNNSFTMPAGDVTVTATFIPSFGPANFTLPAAIRTIEESAFEGNTAIGIVYVPDTCTGIGANAFKNCAGLTQIRLPQNCVIDDTAFDGCTDLIAVFAPAGGTTAAWCAGHNITFAAEAQA